MKIEYKNVNFSYNKKVKVIDDFNAIFESGNIFVIIGNNGKGKSTLVNLLFNIWNEFEGEIKINNKCIQELETNYILARVGICFQKTPIFMDTIKNNILLENNDNNTVNKLSEQFFFNEKKDKDWINTYLEMGKGLSVGQEQKIGILRVLYKNPSIMIFDEPTANLDNESKKIFIDEIERIKEKKIIIIITHELELVNIADAVIHM